MNIIFRLVRSSVDCLVCGQAPYLENLVRSSVDCLVCGQVPYLENLVRSSVDCGVCGQAPYLENLVRSSVDCLVFGQAPYLENLVRSSVDCCVCGQAPYLENTVTITDIADSISGRMAGISSQNMDSPPLDITGTRHDEVNPVSVTENLLYNVCQDTERSKKDANKNVEDTDRGQIDIKMEEVVTNYPLAIGNTHENLELINVYTCNQDGNSGLLNPSATIDDDTEVLPEEIQAELTAHAKYHQLKSTSGKNSSCRGQLEITERNPDGQSRNPGAINESHGCIKHEPYVQYVDCDSGNICNGNYSGSESSVSYISNDSSVHHKLPEGLVAEEPVTPMEKVENEKNVYLHYQVSANKKSCKKNSKNQPNSRPQANFSKVPRKRGRPRKIKIEKTFQLTEKCSSINGNVGKSNKVKNSKNSPDLDMILKFKLIPCSVRLSRLENIETNSSRDGMLEQTSVGKSDKKIKKLTVPIKKTICKQETLVENDVESKISLEQIQNYSRKGRKNADFFREKRTIKKRQKLDKVVRDITFSDDIENIDTDNHVEISDDEYTPKNNQSLHKAFLKSSKIYKKSDNPRSSRVERKVKFPKGEGKEIKKKISNGRKGLNGSRKTQVIDHFPCKKCDFRADRQRILLQHCKEEHSLPWITCHFCEKKFRSSDCLLEHEAKVHTKGKPFKCHVDGCEYTSNNRTDLSRHQAKHSTEKIHVCQLCGWSTKWPKNIRVHNLMKHTEKRKFKCSLCKYTCKRNTDLRQHMFRHTDDKPIQCLVCGFNVKTNWELKSHMLSHSDDRPFKCSYPGCKNASKTNADRLKHMRMVHAVDRSHVCSVCGKGFKTSQTLNKHYNYSHVKSKEFKCDICCKAFKLKSALKTHVLRHAGYKPYICTICSHAFGNSSNLKSHMRTHDFTSRPYRCPLCPYGAKQKEHLLAHIGSFHADTSCYCCELCKKPFQSYTKLQAHYKKMHKHDFAKLNSENHIDLALLKMEKDLEEEDYSRKKNKAKRKTKKINMQEGVQIKEEPLDDGYENVGTVSKAKCEINNTTEATANTDLAYTMTHVQKMCDISRDDASRADDESSQLKSDANDDEIFSVSETEIMSTDYDSVQRALEKQDEKAASMPHNLENSNLKDAGDAIVANNIKVSDSVAGRDCFKLAVYNGLRLPLATRGFEFNYKKSGQKPKAWFMDVNVMNNRDAEKQKAYLRRIGQLPTLRGKYKRKVSRHSKPYKKKTCIADPKSIILESVQSEQDVESSHSENLGKLHIDEDKIVKSEDMNCKTTHYSIDKESEQTLALCIYKGTGTDIRKGEKCNRQKRRGKVNLSIDKGHIKKFKGTKALVDKECKRTNRQGKQRKSQVKDSFTTKTVTANIHTASSEICDKPLTEICDVGDCINTEKYTVSIDCEQIAANGEDSSSLTRQLKESNKTSNLPDVNKFCDDVVVMEKYEQVCTVQGDSIIISTGMPVSSTDDRNCSPRF